MKKTIVALGLIVALLCSALPVAAVFTDVTDPAESRACELLAALNIVGGKGGGRYDPRGYMTRAEFCKVALKLTGFASESLYQGYTRFSDVPNTQWFAPYVNAAVKEYKIIEGYGDGTFRPNNNIKYSEAATILLRLLGYTQADIGDFWPTDYLAKAASLGLNKGMTASLTPNAAIPRGQAAILLVNTLLTDTKEGAQLLSGSFTMDEDRALLLATPATDSTLTAGTARIMTAEGAVRVVAASATLDGAGVMQRGLCVWQKGSLIYFHTAGGGAGTSVLVRGRTDSTLTADTGAVMAVPSAALLCDGSKAGPYSTDWLSLPVGQTATLFYNDQGVLDLIVTGSTTSLSGDTAVYGVDSVVFRTGATILRDGEKAAAADLQKYDVVSYDAGNNTYHVSSRKLTLRYTDAGPVYASPSWVELGGLELTVAPEASGDFKDLSFNTNVTVALDAVGRVAAAWPAATLTVKNAGILTALSESACTVETDTGHKLEGTPSFAGFTKTGADSSSTLYQLVGRMVTVSQDTKGQLVFAAVSYENAGVLDLNTLRMGNAALAANVRIYEQMDAALPLTATTAAELQATGLSAVKILHSRKNAAGKIDLLVVENITGAGYTYGLAKQTSEVVEQTYPGFSGTDSFTIAQMMYTIDLRSAEGTEQSVQTSRAVGLDKTEVPAAWYKLADGTVAAVPLSSAGSVSADAFITNKRVRVGVNTLNVMEDVQVWSAARGRFVTLSEAVLNYQSFALYTTRPAADGGMVCLIVAK